MAIVISYPVGTTTLSTMLLGSQYDSETGVAITKNFSVGSISNLILSLIPPGVDSVFGRIGDVLAVSGDYTTSLVTEGTNLYYTDVRAREAITLTTIGTSGVSTYNNTTGVLNIPQYAADIPWLESNATDLTVWNNGKGNISTNTSFGEYALSSNTSGSSNTAIGHNTSKKGTTAISNVAIGGLSLYGNITGSDNVVVGYGAFSNVSNAINNTVIGYRAGQQNYGTSSNNIIIGYMAGRDSQEEESNKLYINIGDGTPLIGGDFIAKTVAIDGSITATSIIKSGGISSQYLMADGSVTTGGSGIAWLESDATDLTVWNNGKGNITGNTSFGQEALMSNFDGDNNTAIGYRALKNHQTSSNNTAIGFLSMIFSGSGTGNTAVGSLTLRNNQLGNSNVAVGYFGLFNNVTGSNNVAVGVSALLNAQSGNNNLAIGNAAGESAATSSAGNVYIGNSAGPSTIMVENNKLYISNTGGVPLIGGDFSNRIVTIDQVLVLTPTTSAPLSPVNGMIAVYGVGTAQHIYCYINEAWKQLDN